MKASGFTTRVVHFNRQRNAQQGDSSGAVHAPVHHSVPYGYAQVEDLVDIFQGKAAGHAYARQSTPTTDALQDMITQMEGGEGSLVFGTGMAAICAVFLTLLKRGDHLVASRFVFGNTSSVFQTLRDFGIEISLVDATDVANVSAEIKSNTRMVFVETIANPVTQVADLARLGELCLHHGLVYVVDNTITSSYLFQPKSVGASLVISSLTKFIGGHGAVLGGSVTDTGCFDWSSYPNIFPGYRKGDSAAWGLQQIKKKGLRDMGGSLTAESAHKLAMGSETLALRMERSNTTALALARMLDDHPRVAKVYYPGLESHPQHVLASELFRSYGALLSLDLVEGLDPMAFLNHTRLVINATHLGDNRTLALPVAPTIYYEMGLAARQQMGISETMVRCSIGIEETADLLDDFAQALDKL